MAAVSSAAGISAAASISASASHNLCAHGIASPGPIAARAARAAVTASSTRAARACLRKHGQRSLQFVKRNLGQLAHAAASAMTCIATLTSVRAGCSVQASCFQSFGHHRPQQRI